MKHPRDPVERFLESQSREGSWPGATWWVEERGTVLSAGAVGLRAILPEPQPAAPGTLYDLASLTKPLATAALLALLDEEGSLSLGAPAVSFLPGLACAREDGRPTLLDLALHRSGLPAWRPFYAQAGSPLEIMQRVVRLEAEYSCGASVVYSDPGYILLGEILRRASGLDIDRLFRERLAVPVGVPTLGFCPPATLVGKIAPTELGNRHEATLALRFIEQPSAASFRDGLIQGEVHDGNAHALGGAAGHAGLFGAAEDVARLAREFIGTGKGLFSPRTLQLFRENLTPTLEQGRTLGWKRAVAGAREAQGALPGEAFGHTGFTGTSLWLDPGAERIYVLLTNRVHPEVRALDMNPLRKRFHEIASTL